MSPRSRLSTRCLALLGVTVLAVGAGAAAERGAPMVMPKAPEPYARMLPLELHAPAVASTGQPIVGISVRLHNPGTAAPPARLRLIIHDKEHRQDHRELNPDNVKVEVLEGTVWKPVLLAVADGGVMGAIGADGVAQHRERHKRGGFAIDEGFNQRWPLRVTFGLPGTYTLMVAVSPDNGSRHLAQPAHSNIEVR
jgi:hypothetical protein